MRKELSPEHCRGGWGGLNLPKAARSFWMKLVSFLWKPRLLCCVFCKRGNSSAWAAIKLFEPTCVSLPPPIATWRLPSPRAPFEKICSIASTYFLSKYLLSASENKIFRCWSSTSLTGTQGRQEGRYEIYRRNPWSCS